MVIYGLGFIAVYALFTILHWNAWRQRVALELNPVELFLTRSAMVEYTAMASVGLISVLLALFVPQQFVGVAGLFYMSLWFVGMGHGRWESRRLKRVRDLHA
jgi:hypothetical protein